MLNRNRLLSLLILIFSSAVIFGQNSGQNEEQYYFYKSSLISVKVTPPVHYYKDKDNYVKLVVANLSGKDLYVHQHFVFSYSNNAIYLDNTPDASIETPLKHKRIHPGDSLKINLLLDSAKIFRHIKFFGFSLDIHLGYLFGIEKYLKKNPQDKDENTFELSSGIALMLMQRKDIACGYIELHK